MAEPALPSPPYRVTLNEDGAAYEVAVDGRFIKVRLYDVTGDDALIHFETAQAARFRDDVTAALGRARYRDAEAKPTGPMLLGSFRRTFELLEEMKTTSPAEVAAIYAAVIAHVRSANPQALLTTDMPAVMP